ncbi:MlaD family protein [Flavobacterium pedocola]
MIKAIREYLLEIAKPGQLQELVTKGKNKKIKNASNKQQKMKKLILFLIGMVVLSCSKDRTIYFKTANAEGLTEESVLKIKGMEIGEISTIQLTDQGEILIKSKVKSDIDIPVDSEFKIEDSGLIGPKMISLELGKSKEMITEKDTILLKSETAEPLGIDLEKIMNKVTGADKNDSILKELKRLNENLEKQQAKTN